MSELHLNDLSKIYNDQIAEKKKDDSYLEPDMKKRQANNEKARKDLAKGPQMKNPHFEEVRGQDTEMRKAAATDRKAGDTRLAPSKGKGYADQQKQSISYMDKKTKNSKIIVGMTKEGLDPVGKEDGDVNNDGKKNSTDKYLMKRRAAIGKAMGKKNIRGNDSAEQKARLEKKRGMKLDDHPQFKKEESDHNYVEAYLGELHKGRHGQSEKDYQDSRSNAGKMISGDSKGSGANYSYKAKNTGSNPAGGSKKPQGQARMSTNDRAYLAYQKANLKKEELEATGKFTAEEIEKILEIMGE